jgi:lipid-A-disaccharide synthase
MCCSVNDPLRVAVNEILRTIDRRERRMKMRVFLIAGEASGDRLGSQLMQALALARPDVEFIGVGGKAMRTAGLDSLIPLEDLAVMGFLPVIRRLPCLLRRMNEVVAAVLAAKPDVLVIIDSPDFTHRVARRVRRFIPDLPVVDYVSPTVWAWRSGRAKKMRGYIDHVLALLPFEPAAHRRLGGPPCTYVGHPLLEKLGDLLPDSEDLRRREAQPPLILLLPGSRRSEIDRLMPVFATALELLADKVGTFEAVLPAVSHLEEEIRERVVTWRVRPLVIGTEEEKFSAFRSARAALAASGTATLELALARVPMVVAYKLSWVEAQARYFISVPSIVLPNLILGENVVPEYLQQGCTPQELAAALAKLVEGGFERESQSLGFLRLAQMLRLKAGEMPSKRAADIVLAFAAKKAGATQGVN